MKQSQPKSINTVLTSVLHELGLGQRMKQQRALEVWSDVVGERIAKAAKAERIERGKLTVRVSKAPWRNELLFLKKEIIAKLNNALGEEVVKEIQFR